MQREEIIKTAYNKGYRVTKEGKVFSHLGNELSLIDDGIGYPSFKVSVKGDKYRIRVHRLQAYQKFGDNYFEDGIEARHLNGNKTDNSWDNIAIGTHHDNMMDQPKEQRIRKAKAGEKVSDKEALEIRQRVKNGNYDTYQKLAEEYGLKSKSSIHYILNDKVILQD